MKKIILAIGALALLALSGVSSYANSVSGSVLCPDLTPYPGVVINVTGTNCNGSFSSSGTTDANGNYTVDVALGSTCPGCYTATIDTTTLPPGSTLTTPGSVNFCIDANTDTATADFTVQSSICGTSPFRAIGSVLCPNGTPYANVVLDVSGSSCAGSFFGKATTDASGNYALSLPNCGGCYTISIEPATLPAGAILNSVSTTPGSVVASSPTNFCLSTAEGETATTIWIISSSICSGTPPPPSVHGTVTCASSGGPVPNVTIDINGTSSCSGSFSTTATTDGTGSYSATLPNCSGSYTACIDASSLPPGDTMIGTGCNSFSVPGPGAVTNVSFTINCGSTPPPCTNCVDPSLGLGVAAGTGVFELSKGSVSITGPAGGVISEISMAPGSKLSLTGSEYVTGDINLGFGATFSDSSSGSIGTVHSNVDLSAQIAAAYAANTTDASLPCMQSFTTLDGKTVKKITGVSGLNVICVQNITLSGTQILLTGPSDAKFIFNITGKLAFTGGGAGPQIRVDTSAGIHPSAVLYNFIGTGQDVALNGGGGGVNCCAAIIDGTILAPFRNVALSPGLVNGAVISGMNISIVSGSSIHCPPCP